MITIVIQSDKISDMKSLADTAIKMQDQGAHFFILPDGRGRLYFWENGVIHTKTWDSVEVI